MAKNRAVPFRAVAAAVAFGLLAACMLAIVSHTSPSRTVMLSGSQLGFIGGAGVEGGQGNSDSIYGSHDDHSTYGRSGSGWQGPGNGEAQGNLWSPAVGQRRVLPVENKQNQLQQNSGQYVMVPLQGQQQQQAAVAAGYPIYSMGKQDMSPLALGFDDDMPMPYNDDNPFPVVPGSNIHIFGGYEPASPRDNPCARYRNNAAAYKDCIFWANAQLGFIGGAGVEGGQGNSDSIYGSHDDHSTYGRSGSGWQGPGNGEAGGNLWNPAVGQRVGMKTMPRNEAGGYKKESDYDWVRRYVRHRDDGLPQHLTKPLPHLTTSGPLFSDRKASSGIQSWWENEMEQQSVKTYPSRYEKFFSQIFSKTGKTGKSGLSMGDLPIPIGYDGDRDRIAPGSNIHMYEYGIPTTIPWDVTDFSPYVVPNPADPNY